MNKPQKLSLIILLGAITFCSAVPEKPTSTEQPCPVAPASLTVKEFDLQSRIPWLSKKQLDDHFTLYKGYVTKFNEIQIKLNADNGQDKPNKTYSRYGCLKTAETYAENGAILHHLYFENMSPKKQQIGRKMMKLIKKNFGTVEQYKKDFFNAAICSRGWVITAYSYYDNRVRNYVLQEHNQTVPVMSMPLVVLDVYEHAYMIDFGINRPPYLDLFWDHINWDIIEQRIAKWVH